jgi:hypothetical protein
MFQKLIRWLNGRGSNVTTRELQTGHIPSHVRDCWDIEAKEIVEM